MYYKIISINNIIIGNSAIQTVHRVLSTLR